MNLPDAANGDCCGGCATAWLTPGSEEGRPNDVGWLEGLPKVEGWPKVGCIPKADVWLLIDRVDGPPQPAAGGSVFGGTFP